MSDRAVIAASGFALHIDNSANKFNQLPDHEFAQLDAHNSMLNPDMKAPEGVGPNTFVLLPGQDQAACHQAGEAFAVALQHAFREGSTAPDVSVSYLRRDLSRA